MGADDLIFVLVVVPDPAFRRSLEFALETEGFIVQSHAGVAGAFESRRAFGAACAVVDDAAIVDWHLAAGQFDGFARPVILLTDPFRRIPDLPGMSVVAKPFLGAPLVEAVRLATSGAR